MCSAGSWIFCWSVCSACLGHQSCWLPGTSTSEKCQQSSSHLSLCSLCLEGCFKARKKNTLCLHANLWFIYEQSLLTGKWVPKSDLCIKILVWLLLTFVISGKMNSSCLWTSLCGGHCSIALERWEGAMPMRTNRDKRKMKSLCFASFPPACPQMCTCLATLFKANVGLGPYSHATQGKCLLIEM